MDNPELQQTFRDWASHQRDSLILREMIVTRQSPIHLNPE
jgi:hypothetical protein